MSNSKINLVINAKCSDRFLRLASWQGNTIVTVKVNVMCEIKWAVLAFVSHIWYLHGNVQFPFYFHNLIIQMLKYIQSTLLGRYVWEENVHKFLFDL